MIARLRIFGRPRAVLTGLTIAFVPALVSYALANGINPVKGAWLTDDRKAVVVIESCGEALCGRIGKVLDTAPGVPKTDINNPDPDLRDQPITGLLILKGFKRDAQRWTGGRAYDPKTGASYRSTLELNRDGSLKVTGCVLFICRSKRWTRLP